MSLCPFNGFEPCPESCALAAEGGGCRLVESLTAISAAVSMIAETRHAMGEQTVMQLAPAPVTPTEYVTGKGADHYDGMSTKKSFLELRTAMARGEVVGEAMVQRVATNLVMACHPSLYVDGHGSVAKFRRIGGGDND